jgi:tetratricopeptide (TPR) repeat protein
MESSAETINSQLAHHTLGGIDESIKIADQHYRSGNIQRAEQLYRLILQNHPDNASAFHMLGVIASQKGDNRLAVDLISKAVACNSQEAKYYNNLGVALKALDRFEEAIHAYEKALLLKPDYADACYNLGNALASMGRYAAAVEQYRCALSFKPGDAYTYYNIGVAMQELGRHAEAIENFEQAIRMGCNSTEVYRAIAASRQAQNRYNDAIDTLKQALRLKQDCACTHTDLGMLMLLKGDFLQGWKEYSWRLDECEWTKQLSDKLRWDGSSFAGKRLLVCCEQGQGDNIHFVRYLPIVKALGGTVIFAIYKELYSLLKNFPGVDEAVNLSEEGCNLKFDLYTPMMDLPGIFGTTLDTIPNQVPYISADPQKVQYWRNKLSGPAGSELVEPGFKVGIVWSSSPGRGGKNLRDCNLTDFSVLSEVKGVRLYSLQKGLAAEQIEHLGGKIPIVDLGRQFEDFSDTAAAIENLDLIISVDTSVLHLAGAMGKPTWSLQCFVPDWRWMLGRDDSPWYPTMRLFRQPELGNWDDVFRRLAEQLQTCSELVEPNPQ